MTGRPCGAVARSGLFPHPTESPGQGTGPLVSFRTLKSGLTKADSEIGRVMANVADLEAKIKETSTTSSRCLRRRGPHARGGVAEPFAGAGGSTDRLARARRGVDQLLGISVIQNGACGRDMPCGRSWSASRSSSAPRSSTARAQWQGAARCPVGGICAQDAGMRPRRHKAYRAGLGGSGLRASSTRFARAGVSGSSASIQRVSPRLASTLFRRWLSPRSYRCDRDAA